MTPREAIALAPIALTERQLLAPYRLGFLQDPPPDRSPKPIPLGPWDYALGISAGLICIALWFATPGVLK